MIPARRDRLRQSVSGDVRGERSHRFSRRGGVHEKKKKKRKTGFGRSVCGGKGKRTGGERGWGIRPYGRAIRRGREWRT